MTHICPDNDPFGLIANRIWSNAQDKTPTTLYHYCTADGMLSIGKSRKMWSSAFECMNDSQEFKLGLKMAINEIKKSISRLKINKKAIIQKNWQNFLKREMHNPLLRPYVLSFSADPANQHMWKKYADENRGTALRLQFDKSKIYKSNSFILEMSYDLTSKQKELRTYLKSLELKFNKETCDQCLNQNILNLFYSYLQTVFFCAITVKHAKWSKEKEWRLVSFAKPKNLPQSYFGEIKFRTRQGKIVDFLEVDLARIGLELEALIPGKSSSINGLTIFANQNGYLIN